MNSVIVTKSYDEPRFCEKEILRYAGCKKPDEKIISILKSCVDQVRPKLRYKVCYRVFPVFVKGFCCDFGAFEIQSKNLAENLEGCSRVIVFAATIGVEIDRLIAKYGRLEPSKALMIQAVGTERIEALCNMFCNDIKRETGVSLRGRFSPGYGDLSIETQRDIFAVLDCPKHIGLTLNDSMIMSPSKSVTAFVGVAEDGEVQISGKCNNCEKTDCVFRGVE